MLLSLPFRSAGAASVLGYAANYPHEYLERRKAGDKSLRLIVDHTVPLVVMVEPLFELDVDLSREGIRRHLNRWYCLGLLTNAEDVTLNRLGLRSRMPPNWDGDDLTARYREGAIATAAEPNASRLNQHG